MNRSAHMRVVKSIGGRPIAPIKLKQFKVGHHSRQQLLSERIHITLLNLCWLLQTIACRVVIPSLSGNSNLGRPVRPLLTDHGRPLISLEASRITSRAENYLLSGKRAIDRTNTRKKIRRGRLWERWRATRKVRSKAVSQIDASTSRFSTPRYARLLLDGINPVVRDASNRRSNSSSRLVVF